MRRILAVLLTAGVTGVAALSGCASSDSGSATPTGPATSPSTVVSPTSSASAPAPAVVPESLRFVASTVDGQSFDAATLAGKPAVLWFWAAWCPKCRAAADDVAAVSRDYSGRVAVVGVAGLNSGATPMKRFVADTGIGGFPSLADDDGKIWQRFGVSTQEYYVLIDASGKVVYSGPLTSEQLRTKVKTLAGG